MAVKQRARDAKGRALIVHKIPIPARCMRRTPSAPVSWRWMAASCAIRLSVWRAAT